MLFNWFVSAFLVVVVGLASAAMWTAIWASNYLLGGLPVQVNGILVVNFVISVGFCVEFCVHSLVRYKRAKGDHLRKMESVAADIQSVVFQGIFVTKFVGLAVLRFSPIQLFVLYYFRVYALMVLTCGVYGLVVTPVLLDLFGPKFVRPDTHKKSLNDYIRAQVTGKEEPLVAEPLEEVLGEGRKVDFPLPQRLSTIREEKAEE